MGKKILLNVFFNIAILVLVLCAMWLFKHQHYGLLVGAVFGLAAFIYFKLRLIKEVRALSKKK